MPFPISLDEPADKSGLILVQDPALRSRVMPLFSFNPQQADDRVQGQGTTFRIDPWGACITAFHVVEEMLICNESDLARPSLRSDFRLVALELDGVGYGACRVPKDAWRPFSGLNAPCGIETKPLQRPEIVNMLELAALVIGHSRAPAGAVPHLAVDLRRWHPRVGEKVFALGFANLDRASEGDRDDRAISQYLFGSFGEIIHIDPPDGSKKRAWPTLRINAHWPGGMSGGPVFNETGHVVGLVSTGLGEDTATAAYFSAWDIPERFMPSLDPSNPGNFRCFAIMDARRNVRAIGQSKADMDLIAKSLSLDPAIGVSYNFERKDWISI